MDAVFSDFLHSVTVKLSQDIISFFDREQCSIQSAEQFLLSSVCDTMRILLKSYYKAADAKLLADKTTRKQDGLVVERRNCPRQVMSQFGVVEYERTYYRKTADGTYAYPIDAVVGVSGYQRISNNTATQLVSASTKMSYSKAAEVVTGGRISAHTVGNLVRKASPTVDIVDRRPVSVLHIDADEDHITLQNGKSKIVPIVSVYEGVDRRGNRGICRNCWHKADFEKPPEVFWEETLNEIERRYDLSSDTKIYLHGDGAAWIKQGLEWLPNSVHVLDRFHKNKAIKQALSGIPLSESNPYQKAIRKALKCGDNAALIKIENELIKKFPDREKTIVQNINYLQTNLDGITIFERDPEAANGGATEPHVSHVLSARLSSRPMAWSAETLKAFVPILAVGGKCRITYSKRQSQESQTGRAQIKSKTKKPKYSAGLPDPDSSVSLLATTGKITPLFSALRWLR